jgi:hypothetical protein
MGFSSPDIIIPEGGEDSLLVLVITASRVLNDTLIALLLDYCYRVAGPFSSVDGAHMFIRKQIPDVIIFDLINNQDELEAFRVLIGDEIKDIPAVVICTEDQVIQGIENYATINLPIVPIELKTEIENVLSSVSSVDIQTPETQILNFTNQLFQKLTELAPESAKYDIEKGIKQAISQFSYRNSDFSRSSEESMTLRLVNNSHVDPNNFISLLQFTLDELIEDIDAKRQTKWAKSLVIDAIESILIGAKTTPEPVIDFVNVMGINVPAFQKSLETVVPKVDESEKVVFVAYMSLADLGPEMKRIVSTAAEITHGLDDGVASQIITLVGQGSSYHEGIFGPIPIPTANNIIAMIWSSMIKSDIQDERMKGESLSVVAIGFYRSLITRIPPRDKMMEIYSILDNVNHVNDITDEMLLQIQFDFIQNLS